VAIIAALPGELKPLVRGWRPVVTASRTIKKWVHGSTQGECQWIAVCAGMGAQAAGRAFAAAEIEGTIDRVISTGWAGALNRQVSAPSTFIASSVIDAQTGERFDLAQTDRNMILVSATHVVNETEKWRLAATYGGAMVDMESAAILRLATMRGIPVCCVKAISDDLGDTLPDFNPYIDRQGQLRATPFFMHVLCRPHTWAPLLRLGRLSTAGAHQLAHAVNKILLRPNDFAEINRTGEVD
jgi:adenosylhomocysteine nucleosidase